MFYICILVIPLYHMSNLTTILITNDDSIHAPGIYALVDAVKSLATRVIVVAPDKPCSGMGHAVTITTPLRIKPYHGFDDKKIEAYSTTGTPADCVKLAVNVILENEKPTICLSGINHGSNHSINILYSGTMSAAVEASLENIPSIGFSLNDLSVEADFEASQYYAHRITEKVLRIQKTDFFCLNVNIPKGKKAEIKGMKVCRQAYGRYGEAFEKRHDPHQNIYYWMKGSFLNIDNKEDGDISVLHNNMVSIVPIQFDMTNYQLLEQLKQESL